MNAKDIKDGVLLALSAVGAFISSSLGGWDSAMVLLCALMAADYATGVLLAAVWQRSTKSESGALSSVAGFKGLVKKSTVLLVVWVSVLLDKALGMDFIRTMVILFFAGNEGLSLLENLGLMGVPFPAFLKRMLEDLREQGDEGGEAP